MSGFLPLSIISPQEDCNAASRVLTFSRLCGTRWFYFHHLKRCMEEKMILWVEHVETVLEPRQILQVQRERGRGGV